MRPWLPATLAVCLASLALPAPAEADLVFFTSGRTMSVRSHRLEEGRVVLVLRNGGEIVCDAGVVARITPDEVPYPEPALEPAEPVAVAPLESVPFGALIEEVSSAVGVDPRLVSAVVRAESGYRPRARSHKGAMGLMQLMPATARQYAVGDPYDPRSNLEAGARHLKSLLQRFELPLALAAYNAGEEAVRRFGGIPPYRETQTYVSRVLSFLSTAAGTR